MLVPLAHQVDLNMAQQLTKKRKVGAKIALNDVAIPPESRLLDLVIPSGNLEETEVADQIVGETENRARDRSAFAKFGVRFTPKEFLEAAKAIKKHPFDAFESAPDDIRIAVFNILVLGPHGIARHRRAELNRWRQLASLMELEEN